ncbi:MAG TPA: hypothetical protein VJK03_00015 [Candidatus Nanoarchaeia archaeon]|nr:hypothetical protein [Candidatus Nanoarchaeia archaeon]
MKGKKIRVNITVDKITLEKAKKKLSLFGGKLSTLFNAYLADFVASMEKPFSAEGLQKQLRELERRVRNVEEKLHRRE